MTADKFTPPTTLDGQPLQEQTGIDQAHETIIVTGFTDSKQWYRYFKRPEPEKSDPRIDEIINIPTPRDFGALNQPKAATEREYFVECFNDLQRQVTELREQQEKDVRNQITTNCDVYDRLAKLEGKTEDLDDRVNSIGGDLLGWRMAFREIQKP